MEMGETGDSNEQQQRAKGRECSDGSGVARERALHLGAQVRGIVERMYTPLDQFDSRDATMALSLEMDWFVSRDGR